MPSSFINASTLASKNGSRLAKLETANAVQAAAAATARIKGNYLIILNSFEKVILTSAQRN